MRFLLTNDDGVDAPGLAALAEAVTGLGTAIILAPDEHLSGCSHQVTTHRGIQLSSPRESWNSIDGTPVDCVRIGLTHVAPDVDWVLSGINEGGNLGADVHYSGTVAAAREAALLGKPAIAVSQYRRTRDPVDWTRAARWTRKTIETLLAESPPFGAYWNVNLPQLEASDADPESAWCAVDFHPLPVQYELVEGRLRYRGRYSDRKRTPGLDVDVCFSGRIALTRMSINHASD